MSCSTPQNRHAAMERPNTGNDDWNLVHEYLEVTGAKSNMLRFQKVMLGQMKNDIERMLAEKMSRSHFDDPSQKAYVTLMVNNAISNFVGRFEKEQQELMPFEELEKRVIGPIIRKHFSNEDLQALISFYKSPVGGKYISSMNTIMQEISAKTNQEYGQQLYHLSKTIAEEEFESIEWQPEMELKKE